MLPILLAQAAGTVEPVVESSVDLSGLQNQAVDLSTGAAAGAAGLAFTGVILVITLLASIIWLIFFIWWIVLLVDLTKREFPQKTTYLILMILGLVFGFYPIMDLVYYFAIVKKGVGTKKA